MSDDKTPVNPEDEATRWTAGDARRTFGPREGKQAGEGSADRQGRPRTEQGTPAGAEPHTTDSSRTDGRSGAAQRAARPDVAAAGGPTAPRGSTGQQDGSDGSRNASRDGGSGNQERTVEVRKPAQPSRREGSATSAASASESGRSAGAGRPATRRTRKARLRLSRIDPWSVMKTSLLFGVAGAIIFFIATWVVWGVIGASGAFDSINKAVNDLIASPTSTSKFQLSDYVNTGRVLGLTAIIGVIDAVLFTAISTLFSFLYNLAAQIMGGLELTLAED